ncbi:MAG TPA: RDD family protein [Thermomicrobiales bacterium]|nr:RDD family protein [Thermomicrobiales bacterium]
MEYAGFWRRFVAILIDGILLGIVGGILTSQMDETAAGAFSTLIGWLYYAGMESSSRQATIGKSLMGIYVVGLDGERISFLRATGRYFAKILSALIFMIGYIMAAFTARKQALHDILASTLVLKR